MQRFITGHHDDGKSYFLATDDGDHHQVRGKAQAVENILYSTYEHPVDLSNDEDIRASKLNKVSIVFSADNQKDLLTETSPVIMSRTAARSN